MRIEEQMYIDELFTYCDERFQAGEFEEVNNHLSIIEQEIESLSLMTMIAILAAILPATNKLSNAPRLTEKIKARVEALEPERSAKLLLGLV